MSKKTIFPAPDLIGEGKSYDLGPSEEHNIYAVVLKAERAGELLMEVQMTLGRLNHRKTDEAEKIRKRLNGLIRYLKGKKGKNGKT